MDSLDLRPSRRRQSSPPHGTDEGHATHRGAKSRNSALAALGFRRGGLSPGHSSGRGWAPRGSEPPGPAGAPRALPVTGLSRCAQGCFSDGGRRAGGGGRGRRATSSEAPREGGLFPGEKSVPERASCPSCPPGPGAPRAAAADPRAERKPFAACADLGAAVPWPPCARLDFGDPAAPVSYFCARQSLSCPGKEGREGSSSSVAQATHFCRAAPSPEALLSL